MKIDNILKKFRDNKHELYPKAIIDDIERTETSIGVSLPESYCQFVTQFSNGAYLFMIQEVSAVGDGNKQISSIQNISQRFWTTSAALSLDKQEGNIRFKEGETLKRKQLVPFSLDHNGNQWCFVTKRLDVDNEYPVVYLSNSNSQLYGQLKSFAAWLEVLTDKRKEVIRSLYDDDIVYYELGLG